MKFGRNPSVRLDVHFRKAAVLAYHLDALGPPPTECRNYVAVTESAIGGRNNWGMFGNGPDPANPPNWSEGVGDCVEASDGHEEMHRTANAGPSIAHPATGQILDLYAAETGWNVNNPNSDNGSNMASNAAHMVSTGLLGHKAENYAPVNPANFNHVRWSILLFGSLQLGVTWTQQMMNQFNADNMISADPAGTVLGGHCVPLVDYYRKGSFSFVTWGRRSAAKAGFVSTAQEAFAFLYPDWIAAQGEAPSGFNLNTLLADLKNVEN